MKRRNKRPKAKKKTRRKRRPSNVVKFKRKEPKTQQKTVRVPTHILAELENDAESAKDGPISVPQAIVQILESWYEAKKRPAIAS